MRKEYKTEIITYYSEVIDEETQEVTYIATGEQKEVTIPILIADDKKRFASKDGMRLGTTIQLGTEDSEDNYTEVKND